MIGALVTGLFGSLHCVGMCGPVMLAFMGPNQSKAGFGMYHLGRILTYVLIGSLLGLLGATVFLLNAQKVLAFVLGFTLIFLYAIPSVRHRLEKHYYESGFYKLLKSFLSRNLSLRKRWFLSGVANGFFPCGLTYVAAAGAVAFGDPLKGALFMMLFGIGTLPALIILSFAGNMFASKIKFLIPRSVSIIAILSGSIMIMRGMLTTFPEFNQLVQANAAAMITVCGL
ncbi:MAG: sulfite exporter TauE/SafE family protein [Ekhidna sp.]